MDVFKINITLDQRLLLGRPANTIEQPLAAVKPAQVFSISMQAYRFLNQHQFRVSPKITSVNLRGCFVAWMSLGQRDPPMMRRSPE